MKLGERIKSLREEKGLTQKDLALMSGVCQQMVSKLETGRSQQTGDIIKLACALGVSPLWLEGLCNNPKGPDVKQNNELTGQMLHHKAVQITIEFLSNHSQTLFSKGGYRDQAELFRQCYELCTRPENRLFSKNGLMELLCNEIGRA